jgi:hypothetical protein
LVFDEQGRRRVRKKEFPAYWQQLQRLKLWLYANKVQHVAMESTGVYWKPVWSSRPGGKGGGNRALRRSTWLPFA